MNKQINLIYQYIKDNPRKPIYHYPNIKDHSYWINWKINNNHRLEFFRGIRGDLITLEKNGKEIVGFVNQSHQYIFIGINDFQSKISLQELETILDITYQSMLQKIFNTIRHIFKLIWTR